jgi:hypothetical protein
MLLPFVIFAILCSMNVISLLNGIFENFQEKEAGMLVSPGVDLSNEIRVNTISANGVK